MSVTVYTQPKPKGCEDLKKLLKQAEIANAELLGGLSPKQQELLKALPSDPRYAPTVRRLAKRLGRGDACVGRTLRSFEKKGLVSRRIADQSEQNGKVGLVRYCWYRICPIIDERQRGLRDPEDISLVSQ